MDQKKLIRENLRRMLLEKKGDTHEYGCAMLMVNASKKEWNDLQSMIEDEDVYTQEGDKSYGREDEPHITLLYGLHNDVEDSEIKDIVSDMEKTVVNLSKISIFEAKDYDVVKFDVIGDSKKSLSKINKELSKLPHTTNFPDYHPHCTISYVKKGAGKKYIKTLEEDKQLNCKCDKVKYSKADDSNKYYNLK